MCQEGRVRQMCAAGATCRGPGWVSLRPDASVPMRVCVPVYGCVCVCVCVALRVQAVRALGGLSHLFMHSFVHSFISQIILTTFYGQDEGIPE